MNTLHFIVGSAVAIIIFFVAIFGFESQQSEFQKSDFLRIHIRANSNNEIDQRVKYQVKCDVVDYLTPHLAEAFDKQTALIIVEKHLNEIESVANKVLCANGFDYKCNADIRKENFPTRQYDDITLKSGIYDALILELGSGQGNNWWCVVYPPLCFVGGVDDGNNNIKYRSKLVEIINNFFK